MKNKTLLYLFYFLLLPLCSCSVHKMKEVETPFVSVVKLIDAEQALDLEEAEQYMDVVQIYSKLGAEKPMEDWEKLVRFNYNLGKDKKFTNAFGYRNYHIEQAVNGNKAKVCFKAKDKDQSIKMITYELEKRKKTWVVVSIYYLK